MPPEAETPPDVVEGPRSRFATPAIRVRTSIPELAGTGRAAFFFVAFAPGFDAAFFFVVLPLAFFAGLFFAGLFLVAVLVAFLVDFLAAFDFLPEVRAAMLDFPSRSWFFDVRARA